jgi:hypothetical protein
VSGAGLAGHPLNGHGDAVGGSGIGVEQRQPAAPGRRCQQARHAHGAAAPQPAQRRRHRHTTLLWQCTPTSSLTRSGVLEHSTTQENLRLLLIKSTTRLGWGYPNNAHHLLQYLLHPALLDHIHRGIFCCPTWHASSSPEEDDRLHCTVWIGTATPPGMRPCPALPRTYPSVSVWSIYTKTHVNFIHKSKSNPTTQRNKTKKGQYIYSILHCENTKRLLFREKGSL